MIASSPAKEQGPLAEGGAAESGTGPTCKAEGGGRGGMFFILRSFLKRRKGLLSYLGAQRETHIKDGDGLLIIIIKKLYMCMYIYIHAELKDRWI